MEYLKIRNWEKWQTYRSDRGRPPWIKIHRCLMSNPEWVQLNDAQRGRLVSLWILAAERDGEIPADPSLLRKICFMDENPDLQLLANFGFIEPDANVTPTGCQGDAKMTHQSQSSTDADADEGQTPKTREREFPSEAHKAARLLAQLMVENDPKAKLPETEKAKERWLDAIYKTNRIDGRSWDEIECVIRWSQANEFWRANILSGGKLRSQFAVMMLQMDRPTGTPSDHNTQFAQNILNRLDQ